MTTKTVAETSPKKGIHAIYSYYSMSFSLSNIGEFGVEFSSTVSYFKGRKNKIFVLCLGIPENMGLGNFMSWSCNDGNVQIMYKEMYKKRDAREKLMFC